MSYGHDGAIPGYRSVLQYFPATGISVAVQYNIDPPEDGVHRFPPLLSAALRAAALEGYGGREFTAVRCN